jgi:hypothetical protein
MDNRGASRRVYPGASTNILRDTKRRDKPGGSLLEVDIP